ncbi:hypothetical protein ASPBRDRAFT_537330 [Aspergillus brasiliensis CBS 101740]|uniref:Uncharacterized protein n=1 Tax=Aspergillus brasiliensis (strain CBS 101740 / IMI 381727 / IBT 21946) TaxID=767769 RepID=A0A1L9UKY0_ASPBC|nr:hypothetical protein ASPBRDRAFT_537330 [Aspergillus brasiliensis CBS 101740]
MNDRMVVIFKVKEKSEGLEDHQLATDRDLKKLAIERGRHTQGVGMKHCGAARLDAEYHFRYFEQFNYGKRLQQLAKHFHIIESPLE